MSKLSTVHFAAGIAVLLLSTIAADARERPTRGGWDGNSPDFAGTVGTPVVQQDNATQATGKSHKTATRTGGGWDQNGPDLTGARK